MAHRHAVSRCPGAGCLLVRAGEGIGSQRALAYRARPVRSPPGAVSLAAALRRGQPGVWVCDPQGHRGATQFLLIPTARVTGIEDPAILAPGAPNYWEAAWQARGLVQSLAKGPLPTSDLSLAINSIDGRSQDQLHIHIDCIRADVRDALRAHLVEIGDHWAPLPIPLLGMRIGRCGSRRSIVPGPTRFRLLADGLPGARAAMGQQTLLAVGAIFGDGEPGMVLLQTEVDLAHAESRRGRGTAGPFLRGCADTLGPSAGDQPEGGSRASTPSSLSAGSSQRRSP